MKRKYFTLSIRRIVTMLLISSLLDRSYRRENVVVPIAAAMKLNQTCAEVLLWSGQHSFNKLRIRYVASNLRTC